MNNNKKTRSKTPADCWYPLGTVRPVRVTAKQQQKRQALRLPPTARSRRQSRGLHPVGALSVPPLEWYPLGTVRPTRVTAKQQKRHVPGVKKFRVISYSMQAQLQITPKNIL